MSDQQTNQLKSIKYALIIIIAILTFPISCTAIRLSGFYVQEGIDEAAYTIDFYKHMIYRMFYPKPKLINPDVYEGWD